MMSCVTVGDTDKFHVMASLTIHRRETASFHFTIVGMSADNQDAEGCRCRHDFALESHKVTVRLVTVRLVRKSLP